MALKTYVTINGIDVSNYVMSWSFSSGFDENIDEAQLLLVKTIENLIAFTNGLEVIIKRGPTTGQEFTVFRGDISTYSPKGGFFEVSAKEKLWQLQRRNVANIYTSADATGGVISDIAKDIIETYGGMTADVEDSGTTFILNNFICNYEDCFERIQKLRKIFNWIVVYDPEANQIIFKSKGYATSSAVLRYNTIGTTNIFQIPKWDYDIDNIINRVTIIGGPVKENKIETFDGTGSTDVFELTKTPETIQVENPVGTRKTMGVKDQGSGFHYYVDKPNKKVYFVTNTTAGAGSVVINYSTYSPLTVQREDTDSIGDETTGYGLSEDTYLYPDITDPDDAELRASEILERFKGPSPKLTNLQIMQSSTTLIKPGEQVRVVDDINLLDVYLVCTRITYAWPDTYDVVDLGAEPVFDRLSVQDVEERVSKLEKLQGQNINFITRIVDLVAKGRVRARMEVYTRDVTYTGRWGTGFGDGVSRGDYTWGEAGGLWGFTGVTPVLQSIIQQGHQYEEEFMDDEYVIAAETTAEFDTTNGEVRF